MMHKMSGQTQLAEKITTSRICKKKIIDIAGYITRSLQISEDTIIMFISSRQTTNKLQLV